MPPVGRSARCNSWSLPTTTRFTWSGSSELQALSSRVVRLAAKDSSLERDLSDHRFPGPQREGLTDPIREDRQPRIGPFPSLCNHYAIIAVGNALDVHLQRGRIGMWLLIQTD